jgi:ABC-type transporter Mla MlaB component
LARPSHRSNAALVIAPVTGEDLRALCARAECRLRAGEPRLVVCDLRALLDADVGSVEAIARLRLVARRRGGEVRVRRTPDEVRELIDLMGLSEILAAK